MPPYAGFQVSLDVRQHVKLVISLTTFVLLGAIVARGEFPEGSESGDYNFDGHLDYREQTEHPGNQCEWWDYYLFDPALDSYRLVETDFCKEQFDSAKKLVISRINGGMAGLIYKIEHSRWDGLELVLVYAEKQDYDPVRRLFVRTKVADIDRIGGPNVESEILSSEEVGADPVMLN